MTDLPAGYEALDACIGELSNEDIARELELGIALHDSIHELVPCGGMTVTIAAALVSGIAKAIIAGASSFEPDGVMYAGQGRYVTQTGPDGDGELSVKFSHGGDDGLVLIEENLFAVESFLHGVSVVAGLDGGGPWVELRFSAPGPWVGLLGYGANPSSPIRLEGDEVLGLQPDLGDIWVGSDVTLDDVRGDSIVHYTVLAQPVPIADAVSEGAFDYDLIDITASNSRAGQQAVVDQLAWDIGFGQGALTGSASFTITGGAFDYGLYYGHRADHSDDIVYSCIK